MKRDIKYIPYSHFSLKNDKRGSLMNKVIVHLILIGLIFAIFITANAEKVNARGVKQQVLEKQTALLIDSAVPGMRFEINKLNQYGYVDDIKIKNGNIHIFVNGLVSLEGYPFFTRYQVSVRQEENKFIIEIK